ncbi:variant erythrocyte surface antigen-1 family protein, partial [Babesia divergens]
NAAKEKCISGCSQKTGTPSCCSQTSGSDCLGCQEIREKHNDIMSMLRHGYVSSYVNSTWDSLCPKSSSTCCCGQPSCSCSKSSSPCCKSSRSCDPSQCCPDCPQKKAAKIFLGMLPCLYYGLKILYDRCKYGSGFAGWHDITVSNDKPESDLAKFLFAWGFDLRSLKTKKGTEFFSLLEKLFGSDSSGPLQKLSTLVTEKYFTSHLISPPKDPKTPSTVRSMLLWLYGLRFQKHFSELVENCKSLCSPFGNSFHPDAFCYYIHASCFLLPVAIISLIEDPSSTATLLSSSSDWQKFSYPEDLSSLFEKLCEYARKIFVALAFLYYQCERNAGQGGWNDCAFGRQCAQAFENSSTSVSSASSPSTSSSDCSCPNSKTYLCTAINKDPVHDHCVLSGSSQGCLGFGSKSCSSHNSGGSSTCKPCPHPLMRFLIDGSSDSDSQSQSPSSPFRLPFSFARLDFSQTPPVILDASSDNFLTMGFSKNYLPATARWGKDLYHVLKVFCKDGFYPLSRLAEFSLCVSRHPPESLFDLYAFFKRFVSQLNSKDFKDHFVQWIDGEPGWYPGKNFAETVRAFYGSNSHPNGSHTPASLYSLNDCEGPKGSNGPHPTCGKYLYPLTDNVAGVFTPKLCSMYLSWICYLAKDFYSEFQKFHTAAHEKFKSCKSSCKKIVECPCALPFLYSYGFTFNSPSGLNCVDNEGKSKHVGQGGKKEAGKHVEDQKGCTKKSCSDFVAQLEKVAGKDSPLQTLLTVIDNFLWHIRLPFIYAFLYIWILVISYFYYVQFYKLDLLHVDSHLHLPRSFKILPSTLFSDASSKLKDLSYFTL